MKNLRKLIYKYNKIQNVFPFQFKYESICPAISIIILEPNKEKLLLWLTHLCSLFNMTFRVSNYTITENDMNNTKEWFTKVFGYSTWQKAESSKNNPALWGKYIWDFYS